EKDRVGAVHTDKTQPAQALRNRFRVLAHVARKSHFRIAGGLTNAFNAGGSIAVEDGTVLREGHLSRGILRWLPVRIVSPAFDIVDHLAIEFEWDAQFNERLRVAQLRNDPFRRSCDGIEVPGADGG